MQGEQDSGWFWQALAVAILVGGAIGKVLDWTFRAVFQILKVLLIVLGFLLFAGFAARSAPVRTFERTTRPT
jgi:lipoprotein signal peptidase